MYQVNIKRHSYLLNLDFANYGLQGLILLKAKYNKSCQCFDTFNLLNTFNVIQCYEMWWLGAKITISGSD